MVIEYYITRGIASELPQIVQLQIWKLISLREKELSMKSYDIDYFHIFQFNMYNDQLYIKHKQERPEYTKIHKTNYQKVINISKVYVIREDDVDVYYFFTLLPKDY